ncbi:MAG TPA: FlgD immunoglobulin-like domain containing protein [Candidatus Cloacimonadota bacterium]|nr:FlgD immunoglobulin-like domain containing protein [Candidatus Cloacimonadota bacterium]
MNKRIAILACMMFVLAVGLFAKHEKVRDSFDISPNPMERVTTIYLHYDTPVTVTITVEDVNGNHVRTIYSGPCDKTAAFTWERDDDEGTYVPNGTYYVTVNHDSRYTSTKKTLILK